MDNSSSRRKTRGRGPTCCQQLLSEKCVSITTNALGQPIGREAPKLTSFLGILARIGHFLPLTYVDWRTVPNLRKACGRKFRYLIAFLLLLHDLCLKTSHHYLHETDEERLADRDERVLPDQWASLIAHWSSETKEVVFRDDC
ncbi:Hypothetical predicted protein [Olea europaea subsp. europaea]|uniref:Uncharacterized protein n=1 Tax=Olea europaea subsp. europaea TaxID=158383 RepID=A0A8S0T2F7_OLEEU|nr:Hypothetical predicted protein [Olea europaea subsp. europaea]